MKELKIYYVQYLLPSGIWWQMSGYTTSFKECCAVIKRLRNEGKRARYICKDL